MTTLTLEHERKYLRDAFIDNKIIVVVAMIDLLLLLVSLARYLYCTVYWASRDTARQSAVDSLSFSRGFLYQVRVHYWSTRYKYVMRTIYMLPNRSTWCQMLQSLEQNLSSVTRNSHNTHNSQRIHCSPPSSILETMRTPIEYLSLAFTILLHSTNVHGLSSPASTSPTSTNRSAKPIRNIAIVGSGITGLSLAHALENSPDLFACGDGSPIQATVYDARPSLNYEAGAGVQLNGGKEV